MNSKQKQKVDLSAPPTQTRQLIRWVDEDSRGQRPLAVEDRDENDLINLHNPSPVKRHHQIKPQQLKSAISAPHDAYQAQLKFPSKVFRADLGFIEEYKEPEGKGEHASDRGSIQFPRPSEVVKMFHPAMSAEDDSEYRKLEQFENSSADLSQPSRSVGGGSLAPVEKARVAPHIPQSDSDQILINQRNEQEKMQMQSLLPKRSLRSEPGNEEVMRQNFALDNSKVKASHSNQLPTSTEILRKSLD